MGFLSSSTLNDEMIMIEIHTHSDRLQEKKNLILNNVVAGLPKWDFTVNKHQLESIRKKVRILYLAL